MSPPELDPAPGSTRWFATTRWSKMSAARQGDVPEAGVALEKLCREYCPLLHAYIRPVRRVITKPQDPLCRRRTYERK